MSLRIAVRAVTLAIATSTAGCTPEFTANPELITNTCDASSDCGAGGTCTSVGSKQICVAQEADLAGVIFQLDGTTKNGTTVSHVFTEGASIQGSSRGGAIKKHDLAVPAPFALAGRFLHPEGVKAGCTEADGSVPVKVEARPAKELAGLSQVFTGTSEAKDGTNRFVVAVPAGRYDVYIVPQPFAAPACEAVSVPPPAIFRDIDVDPDVLLEPEAATPKRLTGFVIPLVDRDLTGFVVDLVDAERGLPVSEAWPLGPLDEEGRIPIVGADGMGVVYYTPAGSGLVLRISEPEGALVVQWAYESLDLDGDGEVKCELGELIANPKPYEATIIDEQNRPVGGATVTIKSLSLTGAASKNASFRVTTTSGSDGKIHVDLVPGDYQVLVAPAAEDGPAILDGTWQIQPDALCCGKSFMLTSRSLITARVTTARDDAASSVAVLASPALPGTRSYFQNAIESLLFLPRQSATTTNTAGTFAVPVDSGLYDLSIRTASATGFPWLVLPGIVVAPVDEQPASTLEDVVIPFPAIFYGRASAQGVDVAGATLRAFLPLAGSETNDTSPVRVVQIGETIVGDDGQYVLPVPPTVARVVSDPGGTSSASGASSSATGTFQP